MPPSIRLSLAASRAASLLLVLAGRAAAAPCPTPEVLRGLYAYNRPWEALRLAQPCAAALDRELGEIRVMVGDYPGAEKDFKSALKRAPNDSGLLISLAEVTRERPAEALRYAERASGPAARRLAAEIRLDLGDAAGAEKDLRLAGDDVAALRALVRLKRGRPEEAAPIAHAACRAAESVEPWARGAAFRSCAAGWLELKDTGKAVLNLRRALAWDAEDLDALAALLQIKRADPGEVIPWNEPLPAAGSPTAAAPDELQEFGAGPAARAEVDRFVAEVPKAPAWRRLAAYCHAARLLAGLGETVKARAVADLAQRQDPESLEIRRLLAATNVVPEDLPYFRKNVTYGYLVAVRARRRLGDEAGAAASLQKALALAPEDPQALEELVNIELAAGRLAEAARAAERYLKAAQEETLEDLFKISPDFPHLASIGGESAAELVRKALASPETASQLESARARDRLQARRAMVRVYLAPAAQAETMLQGALAAAPSDIPALEASARKRLAEHAPDRALPFCERLISALQMASAFERADAYRLKAQVQEALSDGAGAAASLEEALALVPDDVQALSEATRLELFLRRGDRALAFADKLIDASRGGRAADRASAFRLRAQVERELRKDEAAASSLSSALLLTGDEPRALEELVEAELALGRPARARGAAERLLRASERESLSDVLERGPRYLSASTAEIPGDALRENVLGDLGAPEAVAQLSREVQEDRLMAFLAVIKVSLAEGRPAEALPYAERLLAALRAGQALGGGAETEGAPGPGEPAALARKVGLALSQGRTRAALEWAGRLVDALRRAP